MLHYLVYLFFIINFARSVNVKDGYEPGRINTNLREIITSQSNNFNNNTCISDIINIFEAFSNKELWAMRILDASSKLQSGVAEGNVMNMGSFEECLSIKTDTENRTIRGKYCLYGIFFSYFPKFTIPFGVSNDVKKLIDENKGFPIVEAACVPESCTEIDLNNLVNATSMEDTQIKPVFLEEQCQIKEEKYEFTIWHWITLFFIGNTIVLIISSTMYDLMLLKLQKRPYNKLLTSFSLYTNIKQLMKVENNFEQIQCIHGIRAISMMWIVLGHKYLFEGIYPHNNYLYVLEWMQNYSSAIVPGSLFAVDTFFLISGLLVTYLVSLAKEKNIKFNLYQYYFHRILRLTPAMFMLILFYTSFLENMNLGPLWPNIYKSLKDPCIKNWWISILYLQNYIDFGDICLQHTWYLAIDSQLYVLAPIMFIPLQKWPKTTIIVIVVLINISVVSAFVITWNVELNASFLYIGTTFRNVYSSLLIRSNAWFIGNILGYILFIKRGQKIKINKFLVIFLWILTIFVQCWLILLQVYFNRVKYNRFQSSFYISLSKPVWCICLSWIIFACVHGYGGFINKFLSNNLFVILGRLAYSMYLLHVPVLLIYTLGKLQSDTFSNKNTLYEYCGDLVNTIIISLIWSLCFESPVIIIGKILMPHELTDKLQTIKQQSENTQENRMQCITRL